jgi:hypothetical protein
MSLIVEVQQCINNTQSRRKSMFSKRSFRLFLVPVVALVALAGVTSVFASPPEPASGTFSINPPTVNTIRSAGGNTFIDMNFTIDYTGTMEGISTVNGTLIVHADGISANFHGVEVFTGTVNGVAGTLTFNNSGQTQSDGTNRDTLAIVSGTGELSNLHGVLHEVGVVTPTHGPVGTYTGQLQTAP